MNMLFISENTRSHAAEFGVSANMIRAAADHALSSDLLLRH